MNRYLPLVLLIVLVIAFRCIGSAFPETLPNFQPLFALFFCGAFVFKGWRAWALPLALWVVTYPAPVMLSGNMSYFAPEVFGVTLLALAVTYVLGKAFRETGFAGAMLGSVVAAVAFHLITNGAAWIGNPMYAKNSEGFVQALWSGPVGSVLPTWVFLRNMLAANVLFTAIFLSTRFALPSVFPKQQASLAR